MIKQFFKDTTIYSITNIISRGLNFFLLPLYTRIFIPKDYGIIDILTLITTLVNLTVPLEISQGVARFYTDTQNLDCKSEYASTSFWFTLGAYTVFLIFTVPFSGFLSKWILGDSNYQYLLIIAIIASFFNGLLYLAQNQVRWQLKAKSYSITNLVYTIISFISTIILLFIFKIGIQSIFYANIIASITSLILALFYIRGTYKFIFKWSKCRDMLSFSIPLVFSSISVFISLYIDRICLQHLMSLKDVGIYGIGYRFASIITLFLSGFQSALTPLIFNHYRDEKTPQDIAKIFNIFLVLIFSIILFLSLFSLDILYVFTTPAYYSAYPIIPILSSAIILANMYIFSPGLGIAKKTRTIGLINLITAITNTILNVFLIPYIGIIGAAIATFISSFLSFSLYVKEGQKFYPICYPSISKITKLSVIVLMNFTVIYFLNFINLKLYILFFLKILLFTISVYHIFNQLIGRNKILYLYHKFRVFS